MTDPWATFSTPARTDFSKGSGTYDNPRRRCGTAGAAATAVETFKATTMKRALKRIEDIRPTTDPNKWVVQGNRSLGDSADSYTVTRTVHPVVEGKVDWWCSCYDTPHGDARARKGCTHVLAVKVMNDAPPPDPFPDEPFSTDYERSNHGRAGSADDGAVPATELPGAGGAAHGGSEGREPGGVHGEALDGLADGEGDDRADRPGVGPRRDDHEGEHDGQPEAQRGAVVHLQGLGVGGLDEDGLVGCEECGWVGSDSDYADHYLDTHVGGEEGGVGDDSQPPVVRTTPHPVSQGVIPDPHDEMFGHPGLPAWVTHFRPHQWTAIEEALDNMASGHEVTFLDAPTGSGKTLIGETLRRLVGRVAGVGGGQLLGQARGLYICSGKSLQDQFLADYPYAAVLKGRTNYATQLMRFPDVTCGDCTKNPADGEDMECDWCTDVARCEYEVAKSRALRSSIAVVNTAYLLAEANHIGKIVHNRHLNIMDECDVLEKELMGFVEFNLTERMLRGLGIEAPAKGTHKRNIAKWLAGPFMDTLKEQYRGLPSRTNDVQVLRRRSGLERMMTQAPKVAKEVDGDNWVRDNKAGPLSLKPVRVDGYGHENLWQHGERWLCMSATIVSAEEMVESLGLGDRPWGVVRVPMTFPVKNRPIRVVPVASMTYKEKDEAWPKMAEAIVRVCESHPGERILVHAVSYDLTRYLHREVGRRVARDRAVVTYTGSSERDSAIATYRRNEGAVLIAPSLDRGVDFKGDDCRVVVVAKVPFPSLGDTQVSQRMHGPGGQQWYTVQTIRSLVQMTGRGVRSEDDWCVTYILDAQFAKNVWKKNKRLFPEWWQEGVENGYDGRWLYR